MTWSEEAKTLKVCLVVSLFPVKQKARQMPATHTINRNIEIYLLTFITTAF